MRSYTYINVSLRICVCMYIDGKFYWFKNANVSLRICVCIYIHTYIHACRYPLFCTRIWVSIWRMYVCVYIHTYIHTYTHAGIPYFVPESESAFGGCASTCKQTRPTPWFRYVCMHVCIHVCMHVLCMPVCMYACKQTRSTPWFGYVCMYVCMYVCVYAFKCVKHSLNVGPQAELHTYIHTCGRRPDICCCLIQSLGTHTHIHTYIHRYIHRYIHTYGRRQQGRPDLSSCLIQFRFFCTWPTKYR
jgi:hypothetical protein